MRLVRAGGLDRLTARSLTSAAMDFLSIGAETQVVALLRGVQQRRPDDFWVNYSLAQAGHTEDAIVLVDSTAFVVSVQNRTVITAVGADNMRDRVFTNIDSAVIN